MKLQCCNLPGQELSFTNCAYIGPQTFAELVNKPGGGSQPLKVVRCHVGTLVLNVEHDRRIEEGCIALNKFHRGHIRAATKAPVEVKVFTPPKENFHAGVTVFDVDTFFKHESCVCSDEDLEKEVRKIFAGHVITINQELAIDWEGTLMVMKVKSIFPLILNDKNKNKKTNNESMQTGFLSNDTELNFESIEDARVRIETKKAVQRTIFRPDFDFAELGIGGLDKEFSDIFRRAFASRIFPSIVQDLGINHVRGMLLFGPPGTGKTLIARQIGKMLKAREPKIVNGPEVLNKYVGQAEENIRNLFKDAEDEQKKSGPASALHIVIFDEMDAICRQRGGLVMRV
eukprot:GHVR01080889.1.p1 GENE.GHVR01080889.1~~GHVR01080889.1.p1  ORF type:complete len:343 (-),score=68.95 GHVR01080889.1:1365-2393(-)